MTVVLLPLLATLSLVKMYCWASALPADKAKITARENTQDGLSKLFMFPPLDRVRNSRFRAMQARMFIALVLSEN
jgi:hypothetical protein